MVYARILFVGIKKAILSPESGFFPGEGILNFRIEGLSPGEGRSPGFRVFGTPQTPNRTNPQTKNLDFILPMRDGNSDISFGGWEKPDDGPKFVWGYVQTNSNSHF